MPNADISWVKLRDYSLAWSTREAGYDLTMFEDYPANVQDTLRQEAVKVATEYLEAEYEEKVQKDLRDLAWGVYVIRLSSGFTISYPKSNAPIVYIGRGRVGGRAKSHFSQKLFPLMQSLSGADFDFWISDPRTGKRGRPSPNYHQQLEFSLIEKFEAKFGKKPLLNKNGGTDRGLELGKGWDKPLSTKGQRPKWILKPTEHFEI